MVERVARAIYEGNKSPATAAWDYFAEKGDSPFARLYRDMARTAIAAIEEAGYVIVPRVPTEEMRKAGMDAAITEMWLRPEGNRGVEGLAAYAAMLAAAPGVKDGQP